MAGSKVQRLPCKSEPQFKNLPPGIWMHCSTGLRPDSADLIVAQQIDLCLESTSTISWSLASFAGKSSLLEEQTLCKLLYGSPHQIFVEILEAIHGWYVDGVFPALGPTPVFRPFSRDFINES